MCPTSLTPFRVFDLERGGVCGKEDQTSIVEEDEASQLADGVESPRRSIRIGRGNASKRGREMRQTILALVGVIFLVTATHTQTTLRPTADEAGTEVRSLLADFLKAFNNLDWPAFRKCWVDNPVIFHPSTALYPPGRRIDDVPGFEASWHRVFDLIRDGAQKRGVTQPPFQNIEPKDLRVDFPAPTVAVVTFHLGPNNDVLGRRMFVIAKTADGWKITHLHASNLSLSPN